MEFRVLGQLEIRSGAAVHRLSRTKPKLVLALLLAHANELITREFLAHELWGPAPPRSAVANLHTYVWAIRTVLSLDRTEARLVNASAGYRLAVDEGDLDSLRHRRLTQAGRAALRRGNAATAAEQIGLAAALWRDRPLADLPATPAIAHWVTCLEEQHRSAVRDWVDARLCLGHSDELVGDLRLAVAADPLSERQHAQLIIALYRAGRVGEALNAFADARHTLAEELGLEPGPLLSRLQLAILNQDGRLAAGDLAAWLTPALS